jgi:arylformamidase
MKIFDLTVKLYDGLKTFPSHPRVIINDFYTYQFSAPRYYPPCQGFATKQLLISDHAGTHVDAPTHCQPESTSIDQQALELYFGNAVLLDVSRKELRRRIDVELIEETLQRDGLTIEQGDIVLFRAWSGKWGEGDFHNANSLSLDACHWLREHGMKAVGIDLSNIDDNPDKTRQIHMYLLGEKIPVYENLANLDLLPVKRFLFAGFPLYLKGCTGSPVRAVAFVEEGEQAIPGKLA